MLTKNHCTFSFLKHTHTHTQTLHVFVHKQKSNMQQSCTKPGYVSRVSVTVSPAMLQRGTLTIPCHTLWMWTMFVACRTKAILLLYVCETETVRDRESERERERVCVCVCVSVCMFRGLGVKKFTLHSNHLANSLYFRTLYMHLMKKKIWLAIFLTKYSSKA